MEASRDPIREAHIVVERTARYCTLGEPDADEVWFVLHGYKQLARRFLRRFVPIAAPGRLIVAPEALSRFYVERQAGRHGPESIVGGTWMTREDRLTEIRDYVAYLDRLCASVAPPGVPITVLGFSQGVATAARWVTHGAVRPRRALFWGDAIPPDLDMPAAAEALAGVETVIVRGREDRSIDDALSTSEEERLRAAGVSYRVEEYDGGHDIDPECLRRLAVAP